MSGSLLSQVVVNTTMPVAMQPRTSNFLEFLSIGTSGMVLGRPVPMTTDPLQRGDGFPHAFLGDVENPDQCRLVGGAAANDSWVMTRPGSDLIRSTGDVVQIEEDAGDHLKLISRADGRIEVPLSPIARGSGDLVLPTRQNIFHPLTQSDLFGLQFEAEPFFDGGGPGRRAKVTFLVFFCDQVMSPDGLSARYYVLAQKGMDWCIKSLDRDHFVRYKSPEARRGKYDIRTSGGDLDVHYNSNTGELKYWDWVDACGVRYFLRKELIPHHFLNASQVLGQGLQSFNGRVLVLHRANTPPSSQASPTPQRQSEPHSEAAAS